MANTQNASPVAKHCQQTKRLTPSQALSTPCHSAGMPGGAVAAHYSPMLQAAAALCPASCTCTPSSVQPGATPCYSRVPHPATARCHTLLQPRHSAMQACPAAALHNGPAHALGLLPFASKARGLFNSHCKHKQKAALIHESVATGRLSPAHELARQPALRLCAQQGCVQPARPHRRQLLVARAHCLKHRRIQQHLPASGHLTDHCMGVGMVGPGLRGLTGGPWGRGV
jgi:hypothetical protein